LLLDWVIAADATPLAANAMADANSAMRFFIKGSFVIGGLCARAFAAMLSETADACQSGVNR
jgi:hypothetical protein